jgi:allantoinase
VLRHDNIWLAWGGITGFQSLVVAVLSEGQKRGLSLERAATLLCTNPAKIAGLYPKKGAIQIGADADLMIVNLEKPWTLEASQLHSKHQHSPYVGFEMQAFIELVLLRGQVVARAGRIEGNPNGQWLPRSVVSKLEEF